MIHAIYCAEGDGKLGCLCGKAGTSHLCDGSAHSSGCGLPFINPRRACARVTVVNPRRASARVSCVCVCLFPL